jgi:arylsulfatase A-like enzyme
VCDALINTVDVFATVIDLFRDQAELVLPKQLPIDGVSFLPYLVDPDQRPLREWVYSDHFAPNGPGPYNTNERMVRDARWKLIERIGSADELYDIGEQLFDGPNLLAHELDAEQLEAYARLSQTLDDIASN